MTWSSPSWQPSRAGARSRAGGRATGAGGEGLYPDPEGYGVEKTGGEPVVNQAISTKQHTREIGKVSEIGAKR